MSNKLAKSASHFQGGVVLQALQLLAMSFSKTNIFLLLSVSLIAGLIGWRIFAPRQPRLPGVDHPRLAVGVEMRDITFFSGSLRRDMQYRVFVPASGSRQTLPVVYLLHGGGDEGLRS